MKIRLHFIIVFLMVMSFETYSDEFLVKSSGFYLMLYQNHASPIRANYSQCGFYPSCSYYAKQAFSEYGLFKGIVMTGDRLMRCHPGLARSRYWGWNHGRLYDPPQFEWEAKPNFHIESGETNKILLDIQPLLIRHPWIKEIIRDGEFEFAIFKLKEIIYSSTTDSLELSMITYLLGWLNKQLDHFDVAISYYKKAAFASNIPQVAMTGFTRLAEIYLSNMNLRQLQVTIDRLSDSNNNPFYGELLRWKYLCYIGSGDFEKGSVIMERDANFTSTVKMNKIVTELKKGPPGSPLFAGIGGAILPGSGYLIGGEFRDALAAFLTNLLLIGGTAELIQSKSYLGATFLGMFTLPFYLGNIYGGINAIKLKQINWRQEKLIEMKILLEL